MSDYLLFYMPGACSLAELIALEWIQAPYELCRLEAPDRMRPEYLAKNPQGAVPMMRVGERFLTENAALLLHLADAHPAAGLAPAVGTPERDELHFWLSYLDSGFHAAFVPIFKPSRLLADESTHAALVETAKQRVLNELRFVDGRIGKQETLLAGGRSVLDGYLVAMARWGQRFFEYEDVAPNLARLLKALDQDPGVARAKAIEAGELSEPSGVFQGHVPFEQALA